MIKILYGEKGCGKTRRLIEMANGAHHAGEHSVFVDKDRDQMFSLDREIRLINASEFGVFSPKMFSGFLCGIAAQDYDLQAIYINSFTKIVKHPVESLEEMFVFLRSFSERTGIDIVISMTGTGEPPAFIKQFRI